MKPHWYYFLFLLLLEQYAWAADTIMIKKNTPITSIGKIKKETIRIEGKNLLFPFADKNNQLSTFKYSPLSFSTMIFEKCSIGVYGIDTSFGEQPFFDKNVTFLRSKIDYLNLVRQSGEWFIGESNIKVLFVDGAKNLDLQLQYNPQVYFATFRDCINLKLTSANTGFTDSSDVRVFNSNISSFNFFPKKENGCKFLFIEDTLNRIFFGATDEDTSLKPVRKASFNSSNQFNFIRCYINTDFSFIKETPNSVFYFSDCTFGPYADLSAMYAAKVSFSDCTKISGQLSLHLSSMYDSIYFSMDNTDVDNIKMDFNNKMKLIFKERASADEINNSYQKLIQKFTKENKPQSVEYVDIQYQHYKNGPIWDFVQRIWWCYGYRKYYVGYWTAIFLGIFLVLNIVFWKQMQRTYTVFDNVYVQKSGNQLVRIGRHFTLALLFTVFIFFSLRVNLDKLNYRKLRYVTLFFLEYIVGLWCLFFIIRAILKF